jgi:hypothetical protein
MKLASALENPSRSVPPADFFIQRTFQAVPAAQKAM